MCEKTTPTREFAIYVENLQLHICDSKNPGFLIVYLAGDFPTHQNPNGSFPNNSNFWKNFIVEIQHECDIKVTGMGGPFQDGGRISREVMFVFYNSRSQNVSMRTL